MKKLLFLIGCLVLLLSATAAPALAADKIHWEVQLDFHSRGGPPVILWVNETQKTFEVYDAVPKSATDVRVGHSTAFVNSGNMQVFAKAFFQRMKVSYMDRHGKEIEVASCDESTCQAYWSDPYHLNDWMGDDPDYWLYPYNPSIGAGMWPMDWLVPLLPQPNVGAMTLKPDKYTITYTDKLLHRCADPMFPGRTPGEGPPIGGPWDWWYPAATFTFVVK